MNQNDFIAVKFPNDGQVYYAQVKQILVNGSFQCRFVHSGSIYSFSLQGTELEVVASTGAYKTGTKARLITSYVPADNQAPVTHSPVSVTFDDNNSYIGIVQSTSPQLSVSFLHSNNTYTFDQNNVAHRTGGSYNNRKIKSAVAYRQTKVDGEVVIGIKITDQYTREINGKFTAIIQAVNGTLYPEVYNNDSLYTYRGLAQDKSIISLQDGDYAQLILEFHPAIDQSPGVDSAADEDTTFSGTYSFQFRKTTSGTLHFNVVINYEKETVTASTKEEAIDTVYNLKNKSHTDSSSFGTNSSVEVSVGGKTDFFFIEGTAGGKTTVGTSGSEGTTDTTGTTTGDTRGTVTGTGTSRTWTVSYPMGLTITQI